jgi:hypothetical protein
MGDYFSGGSQNGIDSVSLTYGYRPCLGYCSVLDNEGKMSESDRKIFAGPCMKNLNRDLDRDSKNLMVLLFLQIG